MTWDPTFKPRLRPVEAFRLPDSKSNGGDELVALTDPGGISDVMLTLSMPALHILSLMDGTATCQELMNKYNTVYGQHLARDTLQSMIDHLECAHFLEGPSFEAHYQSLVDAYRDSRIRKMSNAVSLGLIDDSGKTFCDMLAQVKPQSIPNPLRGLMAPHLDYPRGATCYARAYALLQNRPAPERAVILGTNHFGRSASIVSTGNDFQTPFGITRTDRAFVERVEEKCGDLRRYELDHAREHSIELQVAWLQYLFGADRFEIAAFLCHDPCGPSGTAPSDGEGVDLVDFADVLRETIAEDHVDTLIIAGADLSHVGEHFGDNCPLNESFLQEVRAHDLEALSRLENQGPEVFLQYLTQKDNYTRVCSAGSIFVLTRALPHASTHVLQYHQAVDQSTQTCVTCAAVAVT